MKFKPGNILNEYQHDGREGFKDNWLSSYIIVESCSTTSTLYAACLFDITDDGDHKPGLRVAISKDIKNSQHPGYDYGSYRAYWEEVEIAV